MNNNKKGILSVSIGIISAWITILAWAFYKELPTDRMILFLMMFICAGIVPVINLWKHGKKKCGST